VLPEAIEKLFEEALVAEFATIDHHGIIHVHPMLPLYKKGQGYLVFTSSILFSKKVEYIRENPKVSVFFNNEAGVRTKEYFPVLVKGLASYDDSDIHEKWMKYLDLWKRKEPYIGKLLKQRFALPLFWERVIIEVKPIKIYAWRNGAINEEPIVIDAENEI
jgi:general stress protein 26